MSEITCCSRLTIIPKDSEIPYPSDYQPTTWVKSVVGSKFTGWHGLVFLCVGYNPRSGFWMQDTTNESHYHNVSERAIDTNYHRVYENNHE